MIPGGYFKRKKNNLGAAAQVQQCCLRSFLLAQEIVLELTTKNDSFVYRFGGKDLTTQFDKTVIDKLLFKCQYCKI